MNNPYVNAHIELKIEYGRISKRLDRYYELQRQGDDSVLTAQKVHRLEALQQALMGNPEALSR
ncbi:hypothetical protein [Streptomyces sp. CA-106131]|uniref:hypothetical protein n=1 Tax=Streptomyces sp. CA-106131 TaxID=3240045 RepID=UPI003D8E1280